MEMKSAGRILAASDVTASPVLARGALEAMIAFTDKLMATSAADYSPAECGLYVPNGPSRHCSCVLPLCLSYFFMYLCFFFVCADNRNKQQ